MTAAFQTTGDTPAPRPLTRLWNRQLNRYPNNVVRYTSLAIVVLTTIVLYYQQYLAGGVATEILRDTHMSFLFYVNVTVVASIFGAIASGVAGLADRYGRANIVTAGLGVAAMLTLFGFPSVHSEFPFAVLAAAIGFVEGIVLVATPALIRDFSPQLGRASAMGFWTLGPVIGSLVVSGIVTPTIKHHQGPFGWFWEYRLAGIISVVVFAIALVGLRELAPSLRDQLMVSQKDRTLIEMRARGLDIEASLRRPFRQMMRVDVVASAFAISVFLIIYYIAVGFFPIFFETVFGYSASKANGIGNYFWAVDAAALLLVGYLSDRLRVRKPFMVVGGTSAVVLTVVFALHSTGSGTPSYGFFVGILIANSVALGVAYAPWMASFTETVEKHNPALTATGLAVWGMIIRVVIAVAVVVAPHIVGNVTPIITKSAPIQAAEADTTPITTAAGTTTVGAVVSAVTQNAALVGQIQTEGAKYGAQLATAARVDPTTLATLQTNPAEVSAQLKALSEISGVSLPDTTTVATLSATKPGAIAAATVLAKDPTTAAALLANPKDAAAGAKAVTDLVTALKITPTQAVTDLEQLATVPTADLLLLQADGTKIAAAGAALKATATIPASVGTLFGKTAPAALGAANFAALTATGAAANPALTKDLAYLGANGATITALQSGSKGQWRNYFWVAIGGELIFIPLVFLMTGYWSPRRAKRAEQEHEALVAAEVAKLQNS